MSETKRCLQCGAEFVPAKPWQDFDTPRCRIRYFRERKKAEKPGHALENALQELVRKVQAESVGVDDLEALQAALVDYEKRMDLQGPFSPAPPPKPVEVEAKPKRSTRQPTRTSTEVDLEKLRERYQAALESGQWSAKRIATEGLGLADGSLLSRYKGGAKLSQEKASKLDRWLAKHGV